VSGIAYRRDQEPAYPALRIELSYSGRAYVCEGKVDTGASRTCVPAEVLNEVGARRARPARLRGYDGAARDAWTYYVTIQVVEPGWVEGVPARFEDIPVCGILGEEPWMTREVLIGRDLLRNWFLLLEGPRDTLHVQPGRG